VKDDGECFGTGLRARAAARIFCGGSRPAQLYDRAPGDAPDTAQGRGVSIGH